MTTPTAGETVTAHRALCDMAAKCQNRIDGIHADGAEAWDHEFPSELEDTLMARRGAAQEVADRIKGLQAAHGDARIPLPEQDAAVLSSVLQELVLDLEADLEREETAGPEAGNFDYWQVLADQATCLRNLDSRIRSV